MEETIYKKLLAAIQKYYPIDDLGKNNYREAEDLVLLKIEQIDFVTEWSKVVDELEKDFDVMNMDFLQFPNLKLYLEEIQIISHYKVRSNFTLCLSLLCPFYTYFFEYDIQVKTNTGFYPLTKIGFLTEEKFRMIKRDIPLNKIQSIVKSQFPDYNYVDHYPLMTNMIKSGMPYGAGSEESEYSLYQFLFDKDQPEVFFR